MQPIPPVASVTVPDCITGCGMNSLMIAIIWPAASLLILSYADLKSTNARLAATPNATSSKHWCCVAVSEEYSEEFTAYTRCKCSANACSIACDSVSDNVTKCIVYSDCITHSHISSVLKNVGHKKRIQTVLDCGIQTVGIHLVMIEHTCRTFAEVFAQHEVRVLRQRVAKLECDLYMTQLPSLRDCAAWFNAENGHCKCLACCVGGRVYDGDDSVRGIGPCTFQPKWEAMLVQVGATWPTAWDASPEVMPDAIHAQHGDTHHAVYMVGSRDWVQCGWGQPLSSLASPRKRVWEAIVKGTDFR